MAYAQLIGLVKEPFSKVFEKHIVQGKIESEGY